MLEIIPCFRIQTFMNINTKSDYLEIHNTVKYLCKIFTTFYSLTWPFPLNFYTKVFWTAAAPMPSSHSNILKVQDEEYKWQNSL
jgi:hypothetical protein